MSDKQNPDLFFDCLVQNIKNLKKLLYNFYDTTLEEIDFITRIGRNEE